MLQYDYVNRLEQLYSRLQDEQSRALFWARLHFELEPNMDTAIRFDEIVDQYWKDPVRNKRWHEEYDQVCTEGKKLVLYGAGAFGKIVADYLIRSGADFYGFCDRSKQGETIGGKPVLSPEEVMADHSSFAVGITTPRYYVEILEGLREHGFPMDLILRCIGPHPNEKLRYFEFPELFPKGAAFVDAGCYDGTDSIRFEKWCGGNYSKIFAFEPSEMNFSCCKHNLESAKIQNVAMFQCGLSDHAGEAEFTDSDTAGSFLTSTGQVASTRPLPEAGNKIAIPICTLDELVDVEVGMIKMDIEGSEFDALHGARATIQRDKPLLAICIYHRRGDMLAIMDYLHEIVPEYRFWIRHYGMLAQEAVLYAAI